MTSVLRPPCLSQPAAAPLWHPEPTGRNAHRLKNAAKGDSRRTKRGRTRWILEPALELLETFWLRAKKEPVARGVRLTLRLPLVLCEVTPESSEHPGQLLLDGRLCIRAAFVGCLTRHVRGTEVKAQETLPVAAASRLRTLLQPRAPEFSKGTHDSTRAVELSETHALEFLLLLLKLGLPLAISNAPRSDIFATRAHPLLASALAPRPARSLRAERWNKS